MLIPGNQGVCVFRNTKFWKREYLESDLVERTERAEHSEGDRSRLGGISGSSPDTTTGSITPPSTSLGCGRLLREPEASGYYRFRRVDRSGAVPNLWSGGPGPHPSAPSVMLKRRPSVTMVSYRD